jgi:hypothetical protein
MDCGMAGPVSLVAIILYYAFIFVGGFVACCSTLCTGVKEGVDAMNKK